MKTLAIVCDYCGASRLFRGVDTTDILAQIDSSDGWTDRPGDGLPKGETHGVCPNCQERVGDGE